jgi:hypothetical protein
MTAMFLARRAAIGAALGFAVGLSYFLPAIPLLLDVGAPLIESATTMIGVETLSVMLLAFLLSVPQGWAKGRAARLGAAAIAIVTAATFKWLLLSPFALLGWFEVDRTTSARDVTFFALWHVIAAGIILAVYFDQLRRMQDSAGRLRSAQLERQRVERDVLESRLNVIRARVDPVFLFEALAEMGRAYVRDSRGAERLLDDLTRFLRASLPEPHERGSTLGDELHLAAAYLRVVSAVRGRDFRLEAEVPDALRLAFFPPMVLLPLVDDALRRTRPDSPRDESIRVRGTIDNGHARLVVEDAADAMAAAPAGHEGLLATLRAFMGEARLAARSDRTGCTVALEFPFTPQFATAREVA